MTQTHSAVLAVDIGATKMAFGLVSSDGTVLQQMRAPSPKDAASNLDLIRASGRELLCRARDDGLDVVAAGIACGGPLDLDEGLVLSPPNLPNWDRIPITAIVAEAFDCPAHLQNDAAAGAIATYLWDNPDGVEDVTYITVSSGVGCGVIVDGTLFSGCSGNGSELGHIPLIYGGRQCRCGQLGCIEAYVSGTSIGERFTESQAESDRVWTTRDLAALATGGDAAATSFWLDSMAMLNRVVRAAADLFDPALLCIGGGVSDAGADLLAPAITFREQPIAAGVGHKMTVRRTGFGSSSGVLSAAAVAWNELGTAQGRKVILRK